MSSDKKTWDDLSSVLPKEYVGALMLMTYLSQAAGVVLPFVTYFTKLAPPLFQDLVWIVSFLGILATLITYLYRPSKERIIRPPVSLVVGAASLLFLSLIMYLVLSHWTTVPNPQDGHLHQIGFGREEWSLTEDGKKLREKFKDKTPGYWMLAKAEFSTEGPATIWEPWSIYLAGTLLIVLYLVFFLSFTVLWTSLALAVYQVRALQSASQPDSQPDAGPVGPDQPDSSHTP